MADSMTETEFWTNVHRAIFSHTPDPKGPCPCESGGTFASCHGEDLADYVPEGARG